MATSERASVLEGGLARCDESTALSLVSKGKSAGLQVVVKLTRQRWVVITYRHAVRRTLSRCGRALGKPWGLWSFGVTLQNTIAKPTSLASATCWAATDFLTYTEQ